MTVLGLDGSWDPRAAREFRVSHGLWLIDAAARACGVFAGRRVSPAGERAVVVLVRDRHWLLVPVDNGWMAAVRDEAGEPDLTRSLWLRRGPGERHVPTVAWGRFLSEDTAMTGARSVTGHRRTDREVVSAGSET